MPYPDETPSNQYTRVTLSGTEKHWNQVAIAFTALGAPLLAVVLLTYGVSNEPLTNDNWPKMVHAAAVLGATEAYVLGFLISLKAIFLPRTKDATAHLVRKEDTTRKAASFLTTVPIMAGVAIFIVVITPIFDSQTSPADPHPTQQETDAPTPVPNSDEEQPTEPAQQGQTPKADNHPENGDRPTPTKKTLPQETNPTQP